MGVFRGAPTQRMNAVRDQRLLTRHEISRIYGVSARTIDRLIESGAITPVYIGKAIRIAEKDWLAHITGQRAAS